MVAVRVLRWTEIFLCFVFFLTARETVHKRRLEAPGIKPHAVFPVIFCYQLSKCMVDAGFANGRATMRYGNRAPKGPEAPNPFVHLHIKAGQIKVKGLNGSSPHVRGRLLRSATTGPHIWSVGAATWFAHAWIGQCSHVL